MADAPLHADGDPRLARDRLRAEATVLGGDEHDRAESTHVLQDTLTVRPRRRPARVFGADRGRFDVPADFDAPLPERVRRAFDGST